MDATPGLSDIISALQRRKWHLLLPMAAVIAASVGLALSLPPVYRSTATALIEEAEIPPELVHSTITTYAEQRLQSINQRILATQNLTEIITRRNLYAAQQTREPMSDIVKKMRDAISMKIVNAAQGDGGGRQQHPIIAFSVSFDANEAATAQSIAGELVSRFLDENQRARREQTEQTSAFLKTELDAAEQQVRADQDKMSALKSRHPGALPEDLALNMQMIEGTQRSQEDVGRQLQRANEGRTAIRMQFAQLKPLSQPATAGVTAAPAGTGTGRAPTANVPPPNLASPDNPAYIQLQVEMDGADAEIRSLIGQQDDLRHRMTVYEDHVRQARAIEQEYQGLKHELDDATERYSNLRKKKLEADMAESVEQGHQGERFSLIEPADLPPRPIKPNRPAVVAAGVFLGLLAGATTVFLAESLSQALTSPKQILLITGSLPLVALPYIINNADRLHARLRWGGGIVATAAGILLLAALLFHQLPPLAG